MDALDFRILRELVAPEPSGFVFNPRISLRQVARKLGVDKDTVNNRMKKLHDSGFVQGWMVFPNPGLYGLKEVRLRFDVPARSAKDDLVRKLRLVPGVTVIASLYGDSMVVGLFYDSEESLKNTIELISRISNAEDMLRFDNSFPKCEVKLSKTDWDLIRSLQKNPRKPYNLLSRELGLSARTVKRRLERLIEAKAVTAATAVDTSKADGTLASLLVFYADPEHRGRVTERILSHLDDCVFRAELADEDHGFFNLIIPNIARIQEISRWMRDQPGISSYRIDLVEEFIQIRRTLDDLSHQRSVKVPLPA